MSTSPVKYGPLVVSAIWEPEEVTNPIEQGYDVPNPVTGFITIGVELEGAFVPIERRKASGVISDIARAHSAASNATVPPPPEPPAAS